MKYKLMVLRLFDPLDHLRRHEEFGGQKVKLMYNAKKQGENANDVNETGCGFLSGLWLTSLRNGFDYLCELEEEAWLNEFQNAYRLYSPSMHFLGRQSYLLSFIKYCKDGIG